MSIAFPTLNRAYGRVFRRGRLSVGLVVPIENHQMEAVPSLERHAERVRLAESLGFSAVWLRDVPFNVPTFGDAGQTFDPFVYLGYLAAQTSTIGLGVASIILPLRHPAHVAKAAASIDALSAGRLLLGVASGDRPDEYPAMNVDYDQRGQRFREAFEYIRRMGDIEPMFDNAFGSPPGSMDMLPKPSASRLPLLVTGGSQQSPDWTVQHADGWMTYPRNLTTQAQAINDYRRRLLEAGRGDRPVMQPLYLDLVDDDAAPEPIHLGVRVGMHGLIDYLIALQGIGVNHVALNLRFHHQTIEPTLQRLSEALLPRFHDEETTS